MKKKEMKNNTFLDVKVNVILWEALGGVCGFYIIYISLSLKCKVSCSID